MQPRLTCYTVANYRYLLGGKIIHMRTPYTQLYVHLVRATWDRLPLITPAIEPRIYACIAQKCRELKCVPLAIGGIEDHVHLLARLHTTTGVASLAKEVKGASSHLVTHEITPDEFFKWQGAYGAFTLCKRDVPQVLAYVRHQKQHHAHRALIEEWERVYEPESGEQIHENDHLV